MGVSLFTRTFRLLYHQAHETVLRKNRPSTATGCHLLPNGNHYQPSPTANHYPPPNIIDWRLSITLTVRQLLPIADWYRPPTDTDCFRKQAVTDHHRYRPLSITDRQTLPTTNRFYSIHHYVTTERQTPPTTNHYPSSTITYRNRCRPHTRAFRLI